MAMPVGSQPADAPPVISSTLLNATRAAIGVVGFGTVLYAIGFVAIRAHYWTLGISPGSLESQEISDEGGRFLYHLLFLPSSLFANIGWLEAIILLAAPPAIIILGSSMRTRFRRTRPAALEPGTRTRAVQAVLIAAAVIVSAVLVETAWRTLQIEDLLYTHDLELAQFRSEAKRAELYSLVLWRMAAVFAISILLWFGVWRRAGLTERILVLAQWLLAAAALGAWPMVYGKLIISDVRPIVLDATGKPPQEHKLLVRKEGKNYFIWNKSQGRLEILSLGDNQTLMTGPKEHLLE